MGQVLNKPFKRECQMEMLRLDQPYKVGKQYGIHRETARVWWNTVLDEQEARGALGTWSADDIEEELSEWSTGPGHTGRKEMYGNLTEHVPWTPEEAAELERGNRFHA